MKDTVEELANGKQRTWQLTTLSLLIFISIVSFPVKNLIVNNEMHHHSTLQASAYLLISLAGMLPGFALRVQILRFADSFSHALLQDASDERRSAYLQRTATTILLLSMVASLLWTNSALNAFVDLHRGLYVEANLIVYVMGFIVASAWILLLKRYALYGLLFSSTLLMMMIANLLASHSF